EVGSHACAFVCCAKASTKLITVAPRTGHRLFRKGITPKDRRRESQPSLWDSRCLASHPALKRWATFVCPSGTATLCRPGIPNRHQGSKAVNLNFESPC